MNPESSGQRRHHIVVSHCGRVRVDRAQPPSRRRRPVRAGQRSSTCRGVSASPLQRRHRAAGQVTIGQWMQLGVGWRPIRRRYCTEPLQWPARSWWASTATCLSTATTGPARWAPIIDLNQPSGQLLCQLEMAARETAFVIVPTSTGVSCCGRSLASQARTSALSVPGKPQSAGTH